MKIKPILMIFLLHSPILMIFFVDLFKLKPILMIFLLHSPILMIFFVDLFKLKPLWEEHENTIIIILVLVKLFRLFTNVSKIK